MLRSARALRVDRDATRVSTQLTPGCACQGPVGAGSRQAVHVLRAGGRGQQLSYGPAQQTVAPEPREGGSTGHRREVCVRGGGPVQTFFILEFFFWSFWSFGSENFWSFFWRFYQYVKFGKTQCKILEFFLTDKTPESEIKKKI